MFFGAYRNLRSHLSLNSLRLVIVNRSHTSRIRIVGISSLQPGLAEGVNNAVCLRMILE
jgi:hypothetical protein